MIGITRRWSRRSLGLLTSLTLAASALTIATSGPGQAADPLPDGLTQFTAAASCWEIKQNYPASADGTYWLVTPVLVAPEQFYCDMTTSGGGWVLIGRGREGWAQQYEGAGTTAQVHSVITGTGAFQPRQLGSKVVDGLLNGARPDALADGVRLRRATDVTGTTWQEARFRFTKLSRWAWTLGAQHPVGAWNFGTSNGSGGLSSNFGNNSSFNRLTFTSTQAQGWTRGMAFGSQVAGTNSATSYLWSQTTGSGTARPFAQVFLRPQLRLADLNFGTVPDSGTPVQEQRSLASNFVRANPWGVTGLANGIDTELTSEVASFAQIGNTMYVGGNFAIVQRGANATGADRVSQPYLAAFDITTGDFVPGFRPQLNGQVKALAALPNGLLVAGGDFTTAGGQPSAGAVALDPGTGAKAPGWNINVENRVAGALLQVRALEVRGNWLYLGGALSHVSGGSSSNAIYSRGAARVRVSDGLPDGTWNPAFNGTVVALDTSESGNEIYAAGYFGTAQGQTAFRVAELSSTTAAPDPQWQPVWSSGNGNYQQAIERNGDRVYVGGAEHSFFGYDTNTLQRVSGSIGNQGGDFQTASPYEDLVYASCHCNDYMYNEAFTWSNVGTGWTYADKVGYVGAWDATNGRYQAEFDPVLDVRRGRGGWASMTDSNGDTWFGGDFTRGRLPNGTSTWAGGFVRFPERDIAAPTRPGAMNLVTNAPSGARLGWGASTGQVVRYELIRGDRVVATSPTNSIDVPPITEPTRFFVRAVDAAGNRSASTSVLLVQPPGAGPAAPAVSGVALSSSSARVTWTHSGAGVASYRILRDGQQVGSVNEPGRTFQEGDLAASTTYAYQVVAVGTDGQESAPGGASVTTLAAASQLIANGSDWRWRYDSAAWPADWRDRTFDDSSWALAPAVFGFGSAGLATNIDKPAPTSNRPLSAQFRRSFQVADPGALTTVSLTVRADDGVVVYVNGTEVGRSNLPTGALTQNSYALSGPRTDVATANPVTFTVPTSLLVAGTNVVATSVHLGWRSTPDISFDLSMTGQ